MFSRQTGDKELYWVAQDDFMVALQVSQRVILSSGKEMDMGEVGRVHGGDI